MNFNAFYVIYFTSIIADKTKTKTKQNKKKNKTTTTTTFNFEKKKDALRYEIDENSM